MIRTRDAVLFVLCLVVLLLAIMVTVLRDRGSHISLNLDPSTIPEATEGGAEIQTEEALDRAANLARLREKLALDTSAVLPAPDTFVEDVPPEETDVPMEEDVPQQAKRCLYPDDVLPKVASWPVGKVKVANIGNERVAYTEETIVVAAASTTDEALVEVPEVVRTELLALPINPVALPTASCVPSDVIGMTPNGTLLFNNDARIWQNVAVNTLIGYARDGYPIYGRYDGEVDACGGYQSPQGYRYSIGADRSYIVGCFIATPQSFSL
jgi:hypothetical protein